MRGYEKENLTEHYGEKRVLSICEGGTLPKKGDIITFDVNTEEMMVNPKLIFREDTRKFPDYSANPTAAQYETRKHFGNSVYMFTPLYIANYCENYCIYCGFNCHNKINRAKLNDDEIEKEMAAIAKSGLEEILILTGESKKMSDVEYIDNYDPDFVAVRFAKYFKFISNQKDVSNVDPGYLYSRIVAENDHGFLLYLGKE